MYFLKRKTQQKSETENEADDRKEKKKSWAKPNLSQVIIACGFSTWNPKKYFYSCLISKNQVETCINETQKKKIKFSYKVILMYNLE